MKRTILLVVFSFSFLFSCLAGAQENVPCQGADVINIDSSSVFFSDIQGYLRDYDSDRLHDGTYCLLFNFGNGAFQVRGRNGFEINMDVLFRGQTPRDIYIQGFNAGFDLTRETPSSFLLTITNYSQKSVIINNLKLSNVRNGLKLEGSGPIEVRGPNTAITGTLTGACIDVQSSGAVVKSSTISNCGEGIRIAADNVFLGASDPLTYTRGDKNTLSGNTIGIHQISGSGNKWPFNSISGGDGIVVVGEARPPVMRLTEGNLATLECKKPEGATDVTSCEMQFESLPETTGEVEVYKTVPRPPVESQGKDYIARCSVAETNKCIFDPSNAVTLVSNIYCGVESRCNFTLLQTGENSSMYSAMFDIKLFSSIIMSPETGPLTGGAGGGANTGGEANSGGGGGAPGEDGLYIEGNDTGTLLAGEQQGGGPTPIQQQSGSLPVSLKACRFASAEGERAKGVFEMWWWLMFTLPLPYIARRAGRN